MKTQYRFIEFVPHETWKGTWTIKNRKSGDTLGYVGYYKQWKQHVSQLMQSAVFNNLCLCDIADFLDQLNAEKAKPCPKCGGTGTHCFDPIKCTACDGTGKESQTHDDPRV